MKQRIFISWIVKLLLLGPLALWIYQGLQGELGVQPVVKLNIETGFVSLALLMISLWIGVILSFKKDWPPLLRLILNQRRSLGIATGFYVVLHVFFYLAKEGFLTEAYKQLFTKTYLIAGGVATFVLIGMTLTSNNWSVRKLGPKWKILHRWVYLALIATIWHILLIEKADLILLSAWTLPILPFLVWRFWKWKFAGRRSSLS